MSTNTKLPGMNREPSGRQESIAQQACQQQSSTSASSRQEPQGVPLLLPSGKVGGVVFGDTLRKTIQGSKHLLRIPPAIAFEVEVVEAAQRKGVRRLEVVDTEGAVTYDAPLSDFLAYSFKLNRKFGEQRALPLERWRKTLPGNPSQGRPRQRGGQHDRRT